MDLSQSIAGILGITNVPTDPTSNSSYVYSVSAPRLNYQVAATFENSETKTAFNLGVDSAYAASTTDCSEENKNIAYVE